MLSENAQRINRTIDEGDFPDIHRVSESDGRCRNRTRHGGCCIHSQAGGGTSGSTASPANQVNQMNSSTSGYGTPGVTHSDSGMATGAPNSGLPSGTNANSTSGISAPSTNNTLATPSVVSPAAGH